ncbi:MAG: hypothetical protein IKL51_02460 [Lachnospiraceae bacterium]|nr:hypothetical protein [Lachnospiraceae bacterium]
MADLQLTQEQDKTFNPVLGIVTGILIGLVGVSGVIMMGKKRKIKNRSFQKRNTKKEIPGRTVKSFPGILLIVSIDFFLLNNSYLTF